MAQVIGNKTLGKIKAEMLMTHFCTYPLKLIMGKNGEFPWRPISAFH